MAYQDNNTPVIEKITLPSGNTYFIADREIRDVVDTLSQTVAGGVSYNVAWDGTVEPTVGNIPAGVTVTYEGQTYTGTMAANNATPGAFYLVKSSTQIEGKDVYDEYVPVGPDGSKTWEKIGDTQISLSNVVTNVSLTKQTDTVIGTDATFTVTQPTVALETGATAGAGVINVATGITNVTNPSVALSEQSTTATGRVEYTKSVSTTKISASASGGAVSASGDSVTALTGLGTPTTSNVASSVTPTTKKLATTTVTGVSGSTTPNVVKSRTSQTTADGTGTASTTNTDWLKGVSVSNGILTIGAATLDTQTTYSAGEPSSITIPTAASSATTVATGATTTSGDGADVVTDVAVGDTVAAVTGYASPTTDTVLGTASTFNVTNPSITIASGSTGDVTVATGGTTKYMAATASGTEVTPATTNIKATASGANTAWNNKDSVTVLTNTTDVSVTRGGGASPANGESF
jgi:hypothetical protein